MMDYRTFSDETLAAMYFCVRGALAADDELTELGAEPRFRVRDTPAWMMHAADLEAEMISRQMEFEFADWGECGLAGIVEGDQAANRCEPRGQARRERKYSPICPSPKVLFDALSSLYRSTFGELPSSTQACARQLTKPSA
jgi:hypothetical protein